jgi:hypothetical protein
MATTYHYCAKALDKQCNVVAYEDGTVCLGVAVGNNPAIYNNLKKIIATKMNQSHKRIIITSLTILYEG